jgi:hypothetical protein
LDPEVLLLGRFDGSRLNAEIDLREQLDQSRENKDNTANNAERDFQLLKRRRQSCLTGFGGRGQEIVHGDTAGISMIISPVRWSDWTCRNASEFIRPNHYLAADHLENLLAKFLSFVCCSVGLPAVWAELMIDWRFGRLPRRCSGSAHLASSNLSQSNWKSLSPRLICTAVVMKRNQSTVCPALEPGVWRRRRSREEQARAPSVIVQSIARFTGAR